MMRLLLLGLVYAIVVAPPSRAQAAVCGDGVIEGAETCDDGPTNGTDDCCDTNCQIVDPHGRGTCNALADCADPAAPFVVSTRPATLSLSGLGSGGGTGALRFRGVIAAPDSPLDLQSDGLRLTLGGEYFYSLAFGARVPGGVGWSSLGTKGWIYEDPAGRAGGVTKIMVKRATADGRALAIDIVAQATGLVSHWTGAPLTANDIAGNGPMILRIVFHPGAEGEICCAMHFKTYAGFGQCAFPSGGVRMECRSPRTVRACRWRDVDGAPRCAVEDTARAQDVYFALHGTHLTGACSDLPGVELVVC